MSDTMKFNKLFEPITVNGMRIKNRFVMAPMLGGSDTSGFATDRMAGWYEESAKGGVGLIILGAHAVDSKLGRLMPIQPNIDDDKYIHALSKVAKGIQKHGVKAALQIHHSGPAVLPMMLKNEQPIGASAIQRHDGVMPRALKAEEIGGIIQMHVDAAIRSQKAGFDAVEIHAANRYLLNSFMSPAFNVREDGYGGPIENRARLLVEVIQAVRSAVGADYPVFCRINGMEYGVKNGITPEMAMQFAQIAQNAGLDIIDISAVNPHTSASPSYYWPEGTFIHLAEIVKKGVDIPVIVAGRNTPELGEKALEENKVDFIAIARQLVCDPELPNKVAAGRLDDILPCQSCNSCRGGTRDYPGAVCAVNPIAQRQWEFQLMPAEKLKKVLVVGGGPAGMEAAMDAATRGHEVILYEKMDKLGGQLLAAAAPPKKDKITDLIAYMTGQLKKSNVEVRLSQEVTPELVVEEKPDAVIIATGAVPIIPNVPGVEEECVATALDVLWGFRTVGQNVVVVGGGLIGCETADFLVEQSKHVTIIEMLDNVGADIGPNCGDVIECLETHCVEMLSQTKMEAITAKGVKVTRDGKESLIEADSVVLAVGLSPNAALLEPLKGKVPEVHCIGDCLRPGRILEAVHDGFNTAWNL